MNKFNFESMNSIVLPKGENRKPSEAWLADNGLQVPDIPGRCLHSRSWQHNTGTATR